MGRYDEQEMLLRISQLEKKVEEQAETIHLLMLACRIGKSEIEQLKGERDMLYKLP